MRQHVLLQVCQLRVALPAYRTCVRLLAGMDAMVFLHIRALRELLAAQIARERLDLCPMMAMPAI